MTFVIKTRKDPAKIHSEWNKKYPGQEHLLEEIINLNTLESILKSACEKKEMQTIIKEIELQSRLEFNYE